MTNILNIIIVVLCLLFKWWIDICAHDCFYYKKGMKVLSSQRKQCFSSPQGSWQLCRRAHQKIADKQFVCNQLCHETISTSSSHWLLSPLTCCTYAYWTQSLSPILPLQKMKFRPLNWSVSPPLNGIGRNEGPRVCVAVDLAVDLVKSSCRTHSSQEYHPLPAWRFWTLFVWGKKLDIFNGLL